MMTLVVLLISRMSLCSRVSVIADVCRLALPTNLMMLMLRVSIVLLLRTGASVVAVQQADQSTRSRNRGQLERVHTKVKPTFRDGSPLPSFKRLCEA